MQKITKQLLIAILLIVFVVAIAVSTWWLWSFYHNNLRGIGPAVNPPSRDITQLIDKREAPLNLPAGFSVGIFAKDLGDPRVIVTDPNDVMVVSVPARGQVIALPDNTGSGVAERQVVLIQGLNNPHGLAFRCVINKCRLYVAEENALSYYDYDPIALKATNRHKLTDLPAGGRHVTRSLLFLPAPNDSQLLVAIGSDCNVCNEQDPLRAKIMVIGADGGELKEYAKGLRNSVFQAINPATKQVWITEMGRDYLGDDLPPDEINILAQGSNYGWPICYGKNVHDTDFDKNTYFRNPCMEPFETPSYINIPAHSAPLGLAFITGNAWPKDYANGLFVAYHGSWNRSVPTGYKVVRYKLGPKGEYQGAEDFISGWLQADNTALGRPAGLLTKPNGELFISDDKAGVIYRVYPTK